MFLMYYYLRSWLYSIIHCVNYRKSDCYMGGVLYRNTSKFSRKGRWQMLNELEQLSKYWHCWPDSYFRFGMFLKDFRDMDLMKSFVPQGAYYRYSADKDSKYHILVDDKILFHDLMSSYGLPVPHRYFVFQNGLFKRGSNILTDRDVNDILENITDERLFIKRYRGGAASGISIARKIDEGMQLEDGVLLSASTIREKFSDSNYIFEKQLVQDSVLSSFNPSTVNTCRVLTYKDRVVSCSVRMGRNGAFVDNAAKGGIVVSLDMETGCLGEYGMREYDITKYYEHPDSHLKFAGVYVPQWPAVKELAEKTIALMPYYNSVGFDVATTINGPVIIEINTGTGVYASQMGKTKGIADKFK